MVWRIATCVLWVASVYASCNDCTTGEDGNALLQTKASVSMENSLQDEPTSIPSSQAGMLSEADVKEANIEMEQQDEEENLEEQEAEGNFEEEENEEQDEKDEGEEDEEEDEDDDDEAEEEDDEDEGNEELNFRDSEEESEQEDEANAKNGLLSIDSNATELGETEGIQVDVGAVIKDVKKVLGKWSPKKTVYQHKTFFCGGGEKFSQCGPFSSSTSKGSRRRGGPFARRRAGCSSNCKVFKTDCSGFGRWALTAGTRRRNKEALTALTASMRRRAEQRRRNNRVSPLALDFYVAFKTVKKGDPWKEIRNFKNARPGDFLAERYDNYKSHGTSGHVMLVASKPKFNGKTKNGNKEYTIQVADSALSGHARDSRAKCTNKKCGVGFGYVHFEVYGKGKSKGLISGFQWKAGHRRRAKVQRDSDWAVGRFTR